MKRADIREAATLMDCDYFCGHVGTKDVLALLDLCDRYEEVLKAIARPTPGVPPIYAAMSRQSMAEAALKKHTK